MNITAIIDKIGLPYHREYSGPEFENKIANLFDKANEEILISTSFSGGFYEREKVKTALQKAIERGATVKIILDHDADPPPKWIEENKSIELKKSEKKIYHVIVVDRKHLRVETIHEKGKPENVKNHIYYNNPLIATEWYFEFMKLWYSSMVKEYPRAREKEKKEEKP